MDEQRTSELAKIVNFRLLEGKDSRRTSEEDDHGAHNKHLRERWRVPPESRHMILSCGQVTQGGDGYGVWSGLPETGAGSVMVRQSGLYRGSFQADLHPMPKEKDDVAEHE